MILVSYVGSLKLLAFLKTLKCECKNKSIFESWHFRGHSNWAYLMKLWQNVHVILICRFHMWMKDFVNFPCESIFLCSLSCEKHFLEYPLQWNTTSQNCISMWKAISKFGCHHERQAPLSNSYIGWYISNS
jgi:hypothetical protein